MRPGHTGSHVRLLQAAFVDLGYKMPESIRVTGVPDGIYGTETKKVLTSFQTTHKLWADGIAGKKTLTVLDGLMAGKAKPVPPAKVKRIVPPPSHEYTLGTADPPRRADPGSGLWNSQPTTMVARAQMAAIVAVLPVAHFAVGDDAVKHLWHYFGNSGVPLTIDAEGMVREVPSAKNVYRIEVAQAKDFVERLPAGRHQFTSKKLNQGYNRQAENRNWFFAVGGYSVWGKGAVNVPANKTEEITMDFEYHVFDRYNWDNGKAVDIQGIVITDRFMGEFHRQGLAREYDEIGAFARKFHWLKGQSIPESQY